MTLDDYYRTLILHTIIIWFSKGSALTKKYQRSIRQVFDMYVYNP